MFRRRKADARGPGLRGRVRGAVSALRPQGDATAATTSAGIAAMIGEIGATLLAGAQATNDVQDTLERLALRYDRPELRVFVLPTLVLIEDPPEDRPQASIFPAVSQALRLDQADAVDRIVRRAFRDRTDPKAVIAQIAHVRAAPPRFRAPLTVLGYTLLTTGFGLVLNPTLTALPVYVILGLIVGTIVYVGNRTRTMSLLLPAITAFIVTLLISELVRPLVHDDVLRLVAPALVSFLPGLTLTIAAVELTAGQVMAGATRLVYGVARLALLVFGVYAGLSVAGAPPSVTAPVQLGPWAPWVGILLVSFGYYLYSAAPRRSLLWILYALVVAYSAQLLGDALLGAELSGLVGALIVIPAVQLAAKLRVAPSPAIMLTCAYWLLVPGSIGFIGFSEAATGNAQASGTILRTFASLISIAIGMMLGAALSRDVMAFTRGWKVSSPADRVGDAPGDDELMTDNTHSQ